jgi:tetratricopeptide (TPR) repeat protein
MNEKQGSEGHPPRDTRGHPGKTEKRPPFQFLSRYAPLAAIVLLVLFLVPQLAKRPPAGNELPGLEPPIPFTVYKTGYERVDSLLEKGTQSFGREEWAESVRYLGEAHFHLTVMIREGYAKEYPDDLRFYLGLAHVYRGRRHEGLPLIEEEARENRIEPKYPWYLANIYLSYGEYEQAREQLEAVVRIGTRYAEEAEIELEKLSDMNR